MPNICVSCNSSTSNPFKFLLRCVQCGTLWHHRCHKPPVSDSELIVIIKQFNLEKQSGNKNPAFIWRCGACPATIKPLQAASPKREALQASMPLASTSKSTVSRPPVYQPIAIDDDDEEVVILENPPMQTAASNKQAKHSVSSKSASLTTIPTIAEKLIQDPIPNPRTSSKSTSVSGRTLSTKTVITKPTGIRIVDDPFIELPRAPVPAPTRMPPSASTIRPPLKPQAASSSGSNVLVAGLIDLSMSTDEDTDVPMQATNRRDDREDTLEYVTPPPARANASTLAPLAPRHAHIAQSLPPIAAIPEGRRQPVRPLLLPAWINARWAMPNTKPDFRQRAALHRLNANTSNASTGRSLTSSPSRKFKARKLSVGAGKLEGKPSQAPFFFSVDVWLKAKKNTLPTYPTD
ncbi:hypothetical protein CVT25_012202 [Psilocybe cyanescens]|uniref:PHD-type domain-containing protein n=1 Tax=Psilocybe cyanescens TaxID=93625 RepID=A0A409XFK8_PSICY|nr:hypothetical protein CVT25_012202 [Psilocybe cyanescens]